MLKAVPGAGEQRHLHPVSEWHVPSESAHHPSRGHGTSYLNVLMLLAAHAAAGAIPVFGLYCRGMYQGSCATRGATRGGSLHCRGLPEHQQLFAATFSKARHGLSGACRAAAAMATVRMRTRARRERTRASTLTCSVKQCMSRFQNRYPCSYAQVEAADDVHHVICGRGPRHSLQRSLPFPL